MVINFFILLNLVRSPRPPPHSVGTSSLGGGGGGSLE
jgi:hypothetical protein